MAFLYRREHRLFAQKKLVAAPFLRCRYKYVWSIWLFQALSLSLSVCPTLSLMIYLGLFFTSI